MNARYRLLRRGRKFYAFDRTSGKRESLETDDRRQATRLLNAKNESTHEPLVNLQIARVYLVAHDQRMGDRTWADVAERMMMRARADSTKIRLARAFSQAGLSGLQKKKLLETTADEIIRAASDGKSSTNHYLRCLHNLAVGLGWLPWPLVAGKLWPEIRSGQTRAVTLEDHLQIIAAEKNAERRFFYEFLREVGASQTDAASITAEVIDWKTMTLCYRRRKTGSLARYSIGPTLARLLHHLPIGGPLFPKISRTTDNARAVDAELSESKASPSTPTATLGQKGPNRPDTLSDLLKRRWAIIQKRSIGPTQRGHR